MFNKATKVGLYIDEKTVYVSELHALFGHAQVIHFAAGDFVPDPASDIHLPSSAVTNAFAKAGVGAKDVFVALPEKDAIVRYFEMPILPGKERLHAARFESQKYLPFNIQDLYCDYVLVLDKPHKKMKVMVLAAKKKTVDGIMAVMQNAGLKVRLLESASLALLRSLDLYGPRNPHKGITAVVDINKDFTRILIVKDGMLMMTHLRALPDPDLQSCVAEIRLSFNYFSKRFRTEEISRILLCADFENDFKVWDRSLAQELGFPVELFNPLSHYGKGWAYSLGMLTSIGLGLSGTKKNDNLRLNLAPKWKPALFEETKAISPVEEKKYLLKTAVIEAAVILSIFALAHFFLLQKVAAQKADIAKDRSSIMSTHQGLPLDQIQIKSAELNQRISFLNQLIDKRIFLTSKMNAIVSTIPAHVRLTALDYVDNEDKDGSSAVSLHMEGVVRSNERGLKWAAVNQLVAAFSKDQEFMQGFEEIKISSVMDVMVQEGHVTKFAIDCLIPKSSKVNI